MTIITGPRGWTASKIVTRFSSSEPQSYDAKSHSVEAVLSTGAAVARFYGTEKLRIDAKSVVLDRVRSGGIPLLDSHNQSSIHNSLGRIRSAWISRGALIGKLTFNQTLEGKAAEKMVSRGEVTGISCGYLVREWEISNEDGDVLDPEVDKIRWDDQLTYTAVRWEPHEASLVSVPADATAQIRSMGRAPPQHIIDVRQRMLSRERMATRQRMSERMSRLND
jgi:phage head maturation protease